MLIISLNGLLQHGGIQSDEPEPALADTLHRCGTIVGHVVMPKVAPPHQDVGRIEGLVGQAGLGIGKPAPRGGNTLLAPELISQRTVDVVRIDRVRGRALAPDPDPQRPLVRWVFTARGRARNE